MFTRLVDMRSKSGKSQELADGINEKAVPILKRQSGFVDEVVLISHADPDHVVAMSFWNTQEDAEKYQDEQYQTIHDELRDLFEGEPEIQTFDVHTSMGHKISSQRAA